MLHHLAEEFNSYRGFRKIIVTGPQRSGTRFAAQCIAKELGYRYVDEGEVGGDDFEQFHAFLECEANLDFVLQCPSMSSICEHVPEDVLVVFMIRSVYEILESNKHRMTS
jgi:hypothetical protein